KILDFGLAKLRQDTEEPLPGNSAADTTGDLAADGATKPGMVLGTVGYMSPEQAAGGSVDFRADQFALGAIVYEMATGLRAFHRNSAAQTLAAIIESEPQPLAELSPAFPAPARWVVERCLAKDPSERYASTLDIAHELRDIRQHLGESSGSGPTRPATPQRRFRAWHGVAATAALVLAFLVGPPASDVVLERLQLLPLPAERRLAVLPVKVSGGNAEDHATCAGLDDYVVARLTSLEKFQKGLAVVPATEVSREGVAIAREAGRRLGVTLAVQIAVMRVDGQLEVSATLSDTLMDRVLRSEVRTVASPGALVSETVAAVISLLEIVLDAAGEAALRAGTTGVAEASARYAQALAYVPYEQARTALERYDQRDSLERAVKLFNEALERDPRYALAHAGLGETYVRLWQLTRDQQFRSLAEQHCERALALDDLVPQVWLTLGILHGQTGEYERALEDLDKSRARAPQSGDVARERAVVLARMQKFDEAEREYRSAIDLTPRAFAAHSHLAAFLRGRPGKLAESEAGFRRAIELAPENARLWSNLGAVLYLQDRFAEAEAAWTTSVGFHPTSAALSNIATRRFFEARYEEAVRLYEEASKLAPRDYRVWRNYGAALLWAPNGRAQAAGIYRKALDLARQERALDPNNATLLAWLADCEAQTGDTSGARATLAEAIRLAAGDQGVFATAAGVYENLGDRDQALRWLGAAFNTGYSRTEVEHDPNFSKLRADPRYAELGARGFGRGGRPR
nr:tetratricopeptide repeat protein [Acidobacteriota bacterium]